jgi:argininosuccinate lyase
MALWDGRFEGGPSEEMRRFSESLSTDLLMAEEDIAGSVAHATMLAEAGIIRPDEAATLIEGLGTVRAELAAGWRPGIEDEDIHMAVEGRLAHHVGAVAGVLHTARSRNDQVATDVRLWLRGRIDEIDGALRGLIGTLVDRALGDGKVLVPGPTHLQRGQPIWLGHHLLAHAWAFSRDRERLADARKRVNRSPLGAAAMAGTPHPIRRERTAELLGFDGLVDNAMDAVSARDHLIEVTGALSILATHASRLAEELVLWSTPEFDRVRLSDDWSTGSSIMPQKRNPDAAELVRGKTGRVVAGHLSLLMLVKGLPLAYNRDLQEDRPALFDAVFTSLASVRVLAGCIRSATFKPGPDLRGDFLLATEIADFLASRGLPFREAHHVSGSLVKKCEQSGRKLHQLSAAELLAASPLLTDEVQGWLDPAAAAERRRSRGGTAWCEIERQGAALRASL